MIKQDLHIHTIYSTGDGAVEPQQTTDLIKEIGHAEIVGISDHFEYLHSPIFESYQKDVHAHGFYCGCEINRGHEVDDAIALDFDYFILHCRDEASEYEGAQKLVDTGKPVIISHPMAMGADLNKVPSECYIEVNNRYVWKRDYISYYTPFLDKFRFVLGSDAHKPNWLNHICCQHAADKMGIDVTLIFDKPYKA